MFHTYKIQVFPTKEQQKVLWVLSEKCRLLYNFALAERKDDWNENKALPSKEREYVRYVRYIDQQNQLPVLKRKHPDYGWVYSKVLQMTLKKLDTAYKSFFSLIKNGDNTARPPRFRGKDYFFTLCYNQSGFKYHENSINLSHKHPSQTDLTFELTFKPKGKIKQIELFYDYKERWFLAVNCEISNSRLYHDNGLYQAIDLGINNLVSAVNLKSQFIQITNKRPDNYPNVTIARKKAVNGTGTTVS
ncbi:MAG: RNA-guided endonuclease InsQ/TnpB family protein [Candidatus Hodarchaeales archaeon]